ncbi:MAG: T9SS type A sorting domain-containing protein [Phaeodactylibacter sp.]|nr:T9SS type A sorting domain-containing protein [Phaeodactylibacter sp.]MCB9295055.1 T9SS type A sorting domain-containing protein [Lewinellaceae bacterium]
MRYLQQTLVLAFCLSLLSATLPAQIDNFYKTHQSGGWNDSNTWERYVGSAWSWPAPPPSAATSDGILIGAGHEVTIGSSSVVVDQLRVLGKLTVGYGGTLTVLDGPGTDLLLDDFGAFLDISGTLVNNGTLEINEGGVKAGTIENNGNFDIGGAFEFRQGTVTGNDLRYGLTGSLAVSHPNYTVDQYDHLWPAGNGPADISIPGGVTLNGNRAVSNSLDVTGTLNVTGTLTNAGSANISGTLQLNGAFANNGTSGISGTLQANPDGSLTGNPPAFTGCCNVLEFRGADASYNIGPQSLLWPATDGPANIVVPNAGFSAPTISLNASRTISNLNLSSHVTFHAADSLIINERGQVDGTLEVSGTLVNRGELQLRQCLVSGSLFNEGAITVNYLFQLESGGQASGNDFQYTGDSRLIFNNTSSPLNVNAESGYWPMENGPDIIYVQGAGGIALHTPRFAPGLFQLWAPVTNAANLTVAGMVGMAPGGSFDAAPTYTGQATLSYATGDITDVGPEWSAGTMVGAGVPRHVTILAGSAVRMPDGARRCPGNLLIEGTLAMSPNPGASLSVGGGWENYGAFISNMAQVIFDGDGQQQVKGATTMDYLTLDNPAGISIRGHCEAGSTDSLSVRQMLTFQSGRILLGVCSGELYIGAVSGFSDSAYVVTYQNGWVHGRVEAGESFPFPIGPSEVHYNPVTITPDPGQTGGMLATVRVDPGIYSDWIDPLASVLRTWTVIPDCFPGELTFQWIGAEEGPDFKRYDASVYTLGYYESLEASTGGTLSGTDPYTIRTAGPIPCVDFPFHEFVVSNAKEFSDAPEPTAHAFFLGQNEPNPVGASTTIRYSIPGADFVQLSVYDALGREVERLVDERQRAGVHEREWRPDGLPGGVYVCRLQAGKRMAVRTMVLSGL